MDVGCDILHGGAGMGRATGLGCCRRWGHPAVHGCGDGLHRSVQALHHGVGVHHIRAELLGVKHLLSLNLLCMHLLSLHLLSMHLLSLHLMRLNLLYMLHLLRLHLLGGNVLLSMHLLRLNRVNLPEHLAGMLALQAEGYGME
jgi:hypothetical protein